MMVRDDPLAVPADPDAGKAARLDKWLWAARFFKSRTLAKQAIEAGHVRIGGERCKVSRTVSVGLLLSVRQGWDQLDVQVLAVSEQRRGAQEACLLYRETADSLQRREQARLLRRAASTISPPARPTKKHRRAIHQFKRAEPRS